VPFDADKLQAFFHELIASHAPDLLRYKGVVAFPGQDERVVFQGVHMTMSADAGRAWASGEARESKLVFIGRGLPKAALIRRLKACLVTQNHFP
jgi:G3E family GTPase